ncbi:MAG: hypothetical protein ACRDP4_07990 [Nocardioidaceae bacterium]
MGREIKRVPVDFNWPLESTWPGYLYEPPDCEQATCQRNGDRPCDACARAKADYDVRWRSSSYRAIRSRMHARAQNKALQQLRRRYPDEYAELYEKWKNIIVNEGHYNAIHVEAIDRREGKT